MTATPGRVAEFKREIEEIRRMGADVTRPHDVGFSLSFASRADAIGAAQRIQARGIFDISVPDEPIDGCWMLFANQEQVLSARNLERTRSALEGLAAEFGGKYEDWDVGVQMDRWPRCGCAWPDG